MSTAREDASVRTEDKTRKLLIVFITVIFLGIMLFAVSFFVFDALHGKRADQITYWREEVTGFRMLNGKKKVPVEFPADIVSPTGGKLEFETILPKNLTEDTWLYYSSGRNTEIYVNGELRKKFVRNKDTIIGGAVKSLHMFVKLSPEDSGKTLKIVRETSKGATVNMRAVYVGSSLGLIERIVTNNLFFFVLSVGLLVISIISIFIGLLLRFSKRIVTPITSMGIGVLFVSIWLIFDSEAYQLVFRNYYIDGTMSFIMMLLIPYPFVYYLDMIQEHRYRVGYAFSLLFLEIVTVCSCLLHFSGMLDFLTMLPFLAFAEGVIIVGIIVTLALDFIKGYYKSYLVSYIGVLGLLVSCIMELILVLAVDVRYDGDCVVAGLYWTVTLAIIHQLYAVKEAQKEAAMAVRASETKTNFLANMSHEIRTPMNAILGMDEMILRESKNNPKVTKYAADIKSAGNMLLSIINDILDLSKIETGKAELIPTDFEICSVINDIINIVRKKAEDKKLTFTMDADSMIPIRFNGDEIRCRQILLNIINNAVKYTHKGFVKVNVGVSTETGANLTDVKAGDTVILVTTVKDSGIGIKKEDKDRLFLPFNRLEETKNRNVEGTGLGLSIAGNYVHLMGGRIEVDSVYGEGSTFTVYMPLKVVDPTPIGDFTNRIKEIHETMSEEEAIVMAPSAKALIVDDNEMNLEVISGLMERTKIKVDLAVSGRDGLDMMQKRNYDIILLDQMMPDLSGTATLQLMRKKYDMTNIPVIALTADAVVGAKEFYLEKGFDDYLSKPVKAEALELILKKHLPARLLLTKEDIERIQQEELLKEEQQEENLKSIVVVDNDAEALREVKRETEGIYKGTFVSDIDKAKRYLEKHDSDYVLIKKELFDKLTDEEKA